MIINQTIRNGFVTINKTGAYFSLISAGGVVNVRLSEKGRTVLDTKMWVGMSIDKAIPFDEITIQGDDGAVEFWAGDVSMYQARFSNDAARAIKTKTIFAQGLTQLTSSDYLRKAARVRASSDVLVGGAGVQGWRLAAGETLELPVAGTLYAFAPLPDADMSDQPQTSEAEAYPTPFTMLFENWKSDGSLGIAVGSTFCGVQIDNGAGWGEHPSFPQSYNRATNLGWYYHGCKAFNGDIWICEFDGAPTGYVTLYKSTDDGATFTKCAVFNKPAGFSAGGSGSLLSELNGILTLNLSSHAYVISAESFYYEVVTHPFNGRFFRAASFTKFYAHDSAPSGFKSFRVSEDAGVSWRELITDIKVSSNTNPILSQTTHVCVQNGFSNKYWFSEDGGETFLQNESADAYPTYFGLGWWVYKWSGNLKAVRIENGELVVKTICTGFSAAYDISVTDLGMIRARDGTTRYLVDISVSGSMKPVKIEVMELLS